MTCLSHLKAKNTSTRSQFEIRRELIASDQGNPEQAQLLKESARIATVELPGLSATARQLSAKWRDRPCSTPRGRGDAR